MSQQQQIASNEWWSISLFRLLGYGLLVLALFDLVYTFYPANFLNAAWEFQTIGILVERVPVPLIGLWLVFYGKADYRDSWEKIVLKLLSWVALVAGVLFLLLIPVGINAAIRINNQTEFHINTQVNQQLSQLQQFESRINSATVDELNNIVGRFNNQGRAAAGSNTQDSEKIKSLIASQIDRAEQTLHTQSTTAKSNQRQALSKTAIKSFLAALVSGILFIRLWQETRWARRGKKFIFV